ncbi:S41 family peptidase [Sorangium sp. So ce315]|uniref:S41 family peptidase n=1 Tax=Sorangium sp. So ce315 TaxID=3133299 RepID=UPI003F63C32C
MLPASNNGAGMSIGFPDVCLTPVGPVVVPIPYPNFALNAMAVNFSVKVKVAMMNALNLGTTIPMTFGMEPGVAHPLYMDVGAYVAGNSKVIIEGLPAINLTCPTTGNAGNNAVGAVLVPSAVNVFYTCAAAPEEVLSGAGNVEHALLGDGIGVIRIRVFSLDVPALVYRAMRALEAEGMRELVIDLCDNPGGELRAFVELAGDFLPAGSVVATVTDGDGDEVVYRSRQEAPYTAPVTILVNRGTASAAELFAGCLMAHGRAAIAGERTYGKGVGQALCAGEGGARMAAAVRVTLPGGADVQGVGLAPELPVKDTEALQHGAT